MQWQEAARKEVTLINGWTNDTLKSYISSFHSREMFGNFMYENDIFLDIIIMLLLVKWYIPIPDFPLLKSILLQWAVGGGIPTPMVGTFWKFVYKNGIFSNTNVIIIGVVYVVA